MTMKSIEVLSVFIRILGIVVFYFVFIECITLFNYYSYEGLAIDSGHFSFESTTFMSEPTWMFYLILVCIIFLQFIAALIMFMKPGILSILLNAQFKTPSNQPNKNQSSLEIMANLIIISSLSFFLFHIYNSFIIFIQSRMFADDYELGYLDMFTVMIDFSIFETMTTSLVFIIFMLSAKPIAKLAVRF